MGKHNCGDLKLSPNGIEIAHVEICDDNNLEKMNRLYAVEKEKNSTKIYFINPNTYNNCHIQRRSITLQKNKTFYIMLPH